MSEWAISAEGLSKFYPQVRAVDGLNLRVPGGAVYGFLGRNGAGKTTTMKVLLGLAQPTAGTAQVLGLDIRTEQLEILRRVAFVGERKALYDWLTPAELLRVTRSFYPQWSDSAAEKYLRLLEIPANQRFGKLSKGNRTKVCLLLALAQNPELLVLDEPTAGLDPVMVDELLRILIEDHVSEGRTIFFSSHQLGEVEQVADWVGIIDQGKLLLEARLEDIRSEFRAVTVAGNSLPLLRSPEVVSAVRAAQFCKYVVTRDVEAFAAQLRQQGAVIVEISTLNLREIFLELVRKEDACISGNAGAVPAAISSSL